MSIHFHKYQATGNDFVVIDNRQSKKKFSTEEIKKICNRRFGVGADGLILIETNDTSDFAMIYYNSDGSQSLCGNGCRAAVNFASHLRIINGSTSFNAFDGEHRAVILPNGHIKLKMNDVTSVKKINDDLFINTGSPHLVRFVDNVNNLDVVTEGRQIRHDKQFHPDGTNANFVELGPNNTITVRTYERGVEDETLSCGTGVTAAALAASLKGFQSPVNVNVQGGSLSVEFVHQNGATLSDSKEPAPAFREVFLVGPAKMVFEGDLEL
ncbi:MAG TPA: diaminopimelate epimerase [Cyclobacteriaceae bacterium]|nr:diaminopimelate epimerase [Cyclobacteriaceae bacterium]